MMTRLIYGILILLCASSILACTPQTQPPAQQGVTTQQFNQRIGDLEKRIKALEDTSPTMTKNIADMKKSLDEIKLRVNLVETRPIPSGLSPEDRNLLDNLDKRVTALEPTPTPKPGLTPTPRPTPTPTPTPPASAAALTALEGRVATIEKQVQQLEKQPVKTQTPTPTPSPTPVIELKVVNYRAELDRIRQIVTVAGEVVNTGNMTATPINVIAIFYKGDNTVLGYGYGSTIVKALAPGESSPFYFTVTGLDFNAYYNYSIKATTQTTTTS